jgi:hypothetical protein
MIVAWPLWSRSNGIPHTPSGAQAQLVPTATLADGPPPGTAVVKSLVFLAGQVPVLVIAAISDKVEERKVADHLRVARRRVRLATPEEALHHSGYSVGTIPPFGAWVLQGAGGGPGGTARVGGAPAVWRRVAQRMCNARVGLQRKAPRTGVAMPAPACWALQGTATS